LPDVLWINADTGVPVYTAAELRQLMGMGIMYDGRNMGGRKGVRPGGNQLLVSYSAPTITVQPGLCCLDPALTTPQGSYWVAIPAAETHTLTAADVTNPRKDIVICRVYDHDEDVSGLRLGRTEYLTGTAAPSPAEPSVPGSAIKLALLDVPASPGAVVVTDTRPFTASPGGILPVRVAGDITAGTEGRYRDRLDTNVLERDSGSAWETIADPQMFKGWQTWTPVWTTSGTAPTLGNGTILGRFQLMGKLAFVWFQLSWGSTTAAGTGTWTFTLPSAFSLSQDRSVMTGMAFDFSANLAVPAAARLASSPTPDTIDVIGVGAGTLLAGGAVPFTWTTNDTLMLTGIWPTA
jgi:hypothetical protein